jgi:hypothetical protein
MKKSIGRSPRLWSVWATYDAGLDFILNETTGAAYFQDGTSQDEYANSNLTVLRGGFGYDLVTAFASRVANAGGTEFLSTSPAGATGILTDPYTGGTSASGIATLSLSASASVGLSSAGITSAVGQPAQTFAGSTFAGTVAGITAPAAGGTTSYPTTGYGSVTLTASASTSSATVIIGPLTFAGRTLAGAVL